MRLLGWLKVNGFAPSIPLKGEVASLRGISRSRSLLVIPAKAGGAFQQRSWLLREFKFWMSKGTGSLPSQG